VYPAAEVGVPTMMIPYNFDQYRAAAVFEEAGLGKILRPERLYEHEVRNTVAELINSSGIKENISRIVQLNQSTVAKNEFPNLIKNLL
jgi:UDP:flavonoid glycosyltransferase YjiC (YdhE family)